MLTDEQLIKAFTDTNTAEPLEEGWPGLERFAREIERLVIMENMNYRILEKGEIIREGDECDVSTGLNSEPIWKPAKCIGEPAPDPDYISHRVYRRYSALRK